MSEIGMEPQELLEQADHNRHLTHGHAVHPEVPEDRFVMQAAITASILAVGAALTSLLAGQASTDAIIKSVETSDKWGYYQAKSTKEYIVEANKTLLPSVSGLSQPLSAAAETKFKAQIAHFDSEKAKLVKEAQTLENESKNQFAKHQKFALSVASFQIGIVLASISILVKNRWLYMQAIMLACAGVCLALLGLLI